MLMASGNTAWQLEDFVDSLVVELDKTRETLAVKAINKALSYTVREVALDLNIFPSYDGDQISFVTAQPGQQGASKVTIQLGTITDQQVRATSKVPGIKSEINIADIDVDRKTKKQLRKYGVTSADDIKQIENRNVDLKKVSENDVDYGALANQIEKSRRGQNPPRVRSASFSLDDQQRPCILIMGDNLAVSPKFAPVAVINEALAEVLSADATSLRIGLNASHSISSINNVILTVDPFAVVKFQLRAPQP
jgi:hypothetical protein